MLDLSKFSFPSSTLQSVKMAQSMGVNTFIGSYWSAPFWSKKNLSGLVPQYSDNDNFVDSSMYAEFAENVAGTCISFKEATGIDLAGVSIQNEPQFDEPYGSGNYTGPELNNLARVTGQKLAAMGIPTKLFFAENLPAQGAVLSWDQDAANDAVTTTVLRAFSLDHPNVDAIASVNNTTAAGCTFWQSIYNEAQIAPVKENWMSEVAGFNADISGGMLAAGDIYEAVMCGNINLWSAWAIYRDQATAIDTKEVFGVHKNFYYAKAGAVRIDAIPSSNTNILSCGFVNTDTTFVIVAINRSASTQQVTLTSAGGTVLPNRFRMIQTSANQFAEEAGILVSPNLTAALPGNSVTTFIGKSANIAPTINQVSIQAAVAGQQSSVTLTGIGPVETNQSIVSVTATSSNQAIVPNASISATTEANGSSTLTYTPVSGVNGVANISVKVKDNGGITNGGVDTTIMTFQVQVTATAISGTNSTKFTLYPNPTADKVTVSLASGKGGNISVLDLDGKLMLNQNVRLDSRTLPSICSLWLKVPI